MHAISIVEDWMRSGQLAIAHHKTEVVVVNNCTAILCIIVLCYMGQSGIEPAVQVSTAGSGRHRRVHDRLQALTEGIEGHDRR